MELMTLFLQPSRAQANVQYLRHSGAKAHDDGTFRTAVVPMTDDFIKAPDGSFVGET